MGAGLHNHTPIERPAQGLSFGAGLDSISVQLLNVDPLARPAGLTCWISLCLAGFVLSSRSSRCVGSGPTNPYTHRKACSRPFVWCRARLTPPSTFDSRAVGAPNRLDLLDFSMSRWIGCQVPELENGWEQAYEPIHPSKGLLKAFRLVPGSTLSAFRF